MNKLILSFVLALVTSQLAAQGDSWSTIQNRGSGTLACVYYPTPGLVFDENGQVKGMCVDILKDFQTYVKDKHGKDVNIEFVKQEQVWNDFLNAVMSTPNILGVANVTITQERKQKMHFTQPFMNNALTLLTHNNAPTVNSLDEIATTLKGYTALIISGSTHERALKDLKKKYWPDVPIEYTNSAKETIQQLLKGGKYFTILEFTEFINSVRKREPLKRHNIEVSDKKEELAFVMPLNSDWKGIWDEFLTPEYKQSVQYKKNVVNNLGQAFLNIMR